MAAAVAGSPMVPTSAKGDRFSLALRVSGFGVRGLGFGVWGSGFGVRGSGFGVRLPCGLVRLLMRSQTVEPRDVWGDCGVCLAGMVTSLRDGLGGQVGWGAVRAELFGTSPLQLPGDVPVDHSTYGV